MRPTIRCARSPILFIILGALTILTMTASIWVHYYYSLIGTESISTTITQRDVSSTEASIYSFPAEGWIPNRQIVTPLWSCHSVQSIKYPGSNSTIFQGRSSTKLVFVHVFKTAGMTMRELLFRYAQKCNAGIGLVSDCSGLSSDSITATTTLGSTTNNMNTSQTTKYWTNEFGSKRGRPCKMHAINQTQHIVSLPNFRARSPLSSSQLDILAGHLPLGAGSAWDIPLVYKPTKVQYVVFFRRAIDKFVSGIMYQKRGKKYSFDDIVNLIYKRARRELNQQKYREGYSAYLLTPQQKKYFYGPNITRSSILARTRQILQNLNQENVLVGIVEKMSESLELLQFMLDQDYNQTRLFESFGMKPSRVGTRNDGSDTNSTRRSGERDDGSGNNDTSIYSSGGQVKINNPSKFSTASVVAVLEKDSKFFAELSEYVKYDQQIYDHALRLHTLQYNSLLQLRQNAGKH